MPYPTPVAQTSQILHSCKVIEGSLDGSHESPQKICRNQAVELKSLGSDF